MRKCRFQIAHSDTRTDHLNMSTKPPGTTARALRGEMLCPCADVSHRDFASFLQANSALSFEETLRKAGVGVNCTACLLDLEYSFSAAGRGDVALSGSSAPKATVQQAGLKSALYRAIDGVAPLVTSHVETWSPVLLGGGIVQRLWITNQHLLYKRGIDGPVPHIAEVTIRDAGGNVRHSARYDVSVDAVLDLELSRFLTDDGEVPDIAAGSIQIRQSWAKPGLRGTTRSQIEIATTKAVCAVHTQAPGPAATHRFTALSRPAEERLFYTVVNPSPQPLTGRVTVCGADTEASDPIAIPAFGAVVSEIGAPASGRGVPEDGVIGLAWQLDGHHKLHVICASPCLDRFSIDHL